jgi:hypothetical protein
MVTDTVAETVEYDSVVTTISNVRMFALRGARCERVIEEDGEERQCTNQARFLLAGDENATGFCGHRHHRPKYPDEWIDALDYECDKYVTRRDGDEENPTCGAQGVVLLKQPNGDETVRCREHARWSWLNEFPVMKDDE